MTGFWWEWSSGVSSSGVSFSRLKCSDWRSIFSQPVRATFIDLGLFLKTDGVQNWNADFRCWVSDLINASVFEYVVTSTPNSVYRFSVDLYSETAGINWTNCGNGLKIGLVCAFHSKLHNLLYTVILLCTICDTTELFVTAAMFCACILLCVQI